MTSHPKRRSRLPFYFCLVSFGVVVVVFLVSASLLMSTASNLTTMQGLNPIDAFGPPSLEVVNDRDASVDQKTDSENTEDETDGESAPPPPMKLSLPVFITALPKSGTTTMHEYFSCGGQRSGHHVNKRCWKSRREHDPDCFFYLSDCIQHNIQLGQPPLQSNCGDFDIYSDTGFEDYERCFNPTLSNLDTLVAAYPNMTLLHVTRNETQWFESIAKYQQATILRHWKNCQSPDGMFPMKNPSSETFMELYRNHTRNVRAVAAASKSVTYLEVALEDPNTPGILQDATGIDQSCWQKSNTAEDNLIKTQNAIRRQRQRKSRSREANPAS